MKRRLGALASVALLLATATSCGPRFQSALDPAGIQAARIEGLWWIMFWVCVVVFVLVTGSISVAAWRRHAAHEEQLIPPIEDEPGDRARIVKITAAVALTVLTLFGLLFASVRTGKQVSHLDSKSPVSIQVIGHQWWWEVVYQSSDPSQIVRTANEIHIPVGVPVVLNTASQDVIHSFWAPNIQGKRDLIPGYSTAIWFQADREGTYRGQCAEFCGHQHAHMSFLVIAESPDKFQQWMLQQVQAAKDPTETAAVRGREVFLSHPCVMCHTIRGTEANSRFGPDLTHLASRSTIAAGTLPNTRGNLGGWIVNSQSIKPGNRMPPNPLSADDLQALLAYLETLK